MLTRLFSFNGGDTGLWRVTDMNAIMGEPLPVIKNLGISSGSQPLLEQDTVWNLRGITSNERYVDRIERTQIVDKQLALGRSDATRAALIPIRKNDAWWALTQDERLQIFKDRSQHTQIGLQTFPELARRLHHCRDLSEHEPFDFITWFEYPPEHEALFNRLLAALRATPEWDYVDREMDIRLVVNAA